MTKRGSIDGIEALHILARRAPLDVKIGERKEIYVLDIDQSYPGLKDALIKAGFAVLRFNNRTRDLLLTDEASQIITLLWRTLYNDC